MVSDTAPEQQRRYTELLRAQDPVARFRASGALTRTVRQLAWAGLKARHPEDSDEDLKVRLTIQIYGIDAARRLFRGHRLVSP